MATMRKVIYGGACSLDGYFAGQDGAVDWLIYSRGVEEIMRRSWAATDTILMGRKTWEFARAMSAAGTEAPAVAAKSYVFSRTLTSLPDPDAELVTTDAGAIVR